MNRKKPYFWAAAACLLALVWAGVYFNQTINEDQMVEVAALKEEVQRLTSPKNSLSSEIQNVVKLKTESDQLDKWIGQRFQWASVLKGMRQAMVTTENQMFAKFSQKTGVWVIMFNKVAASDLYEGNTDMMGGMGMMGMMKVKVKEG